MFDKAEGVEVPIHLSAQADNTRGFSTARSSFPGSSIPHEFHRLTYIRKLRALRAWRRRSCASLALVDDEGAPPPQGQFRTLLMGRAGRPGCADAAARGIRGVFMLAIAQTARRGPAERPVRNPPA